MADFKATITSTMPMTNYHHNILVSNGHTVDEFMKFKAVVILVGMASHDEAMAFLKSKNICPRMGFEIDLTEVGGEPESVEDPKAADIYLTSTAAEAAEFAADRIDPDLEAVEAELVPEPISEVVEPEPAKEPKVVEGAGVGAVSAAFYLTRTVIEAAAKSLPAGYTHEVCLYEHLCQGGELEFVQEINHLGIIAAGALDELLAEDDELCLPGVFEYEQLSTDYECNIAHHLLACIFDEDPYIPDTKEWYDACKTILGVWLNGEPRPVKDILESVKKSGKIFEANIELAHHGLQIIRFSDSFVVKTL